MDQSIADILAHIPDVDIHINEPLAAHTGFHTGGAADCLAAPKNRQSLLDTITALHKNEIPFYIFGRGSNILALDEGYRGCVVKTTSALDELAFFPDGRVVCGAGVSLDVLCRRCAEAGLSGLEFAYGIPGSAGGAVFMNAGAYGGEMSDVITAVEVLDPDGFVRTLPKEEMGFGYRQSAIQNSGMVVLSVGFRLKTGDPREIRAVMNEFIGRRRDKQPLDLPSCGSTFKRPDGAYASKLVEDCGLRGHTIGGAAVSEKHCGFVVNKGGATSSDILALIEYIQKVVKRKTGYQLICEIQILR